VNLRVVHLAVGGYLVTGIVMQTEVANGAAVIAAEVGKKVVAVGASAVGVLGRAAEDFVISQPSHGDRF
jgi:actin-like ATPase involved in cell morphogenesis